MFGKPKKRPASARRRAEADEEDDPEVRALMAQIHEMAAQVYENQQLIEELEQRFPMCKNLSRALTEDAAHVVHIAVRSHACPPALQVGGRNQGLHEQVGCCSRRTFVAPEKPRNTHTKNEVSDAN